MRGLPALLEVPPRLMLVQAAGAKLALIACGLRLLAVVCQRFAGGAMLLRIRMV